ncbi:MAG: hypothetical protein WD200_00315 [Candidatus Andersenbacteria bacterium]
MARRGTSKDIDTPATLSYEEMGKEILRILQSIDAKLTPAHSRSPSQVTALKNDVLKLKLENK